MDRRRRIKSLLPMDRIIAGLRLKSGRDVDQLPYNIVAPAVHH